MTFRRTTTLALVVAMLAVPTTAFADDDVAETDRPTVTDTERDTARDHRTFEEAQERVLAEIDKRLRVLATLSEKISTNRHITEGHAGQLRGDINPATAHLEALRRKVEDATTWAELRPLIEQIDDDKVLVLLAPKTAQVIASDTLVAFSGTATSVSGTLESVIDRFEAAGFDVGEAWRMLAEMNDFIAAAERLADPVAENVIGLNPAEWPDPASAVLAQGRADLRDAGSALRNAKATAAEIVEFLRTIYDGQTDLSGQAETDL
jgi:hypothetical protein